MFEKGVNDGVREAWGSFVRPDVSFRRGQTRCGGRRRWRRGTHQQYTAEQNEHPALPLVYRIRAEHEDNYPTEVSKHYKKKRC